MSRSARRLAAPLLLVALTLLVAAPAAEAGKGWCSSDPAVLLDGVLVDVWVASTADAYLAATGPTVVVVAVPPGTDASPVISDAGFGHGYDVRIAETADLVRTGEGLPIRVAVYVPADDGALPIRVEVAARAVGALAPLTAEGTANTWIGLAATV